MALTPKQSRFVEEYLVDLNATQAAIRAGYSVDTAQEQGSRLLSNAMVAIAVANARAALSERVEMDQEWVLRRLRTIADRCMQVSPVTDRKGDPVLVEDDDGNIVPAFTFDAGGANRATELIGKHLGMFKERVEHAGPGGGPIQHAVLDAASLSPDQRAAVRAALLAAKGKK